MIKTLLASALIVVSLATPRAQAGELFSQGLQDRTAWEIWFSSLSGDERAGAEYWAGQRSLPNPGNCIGTPDFQTGCNEARAKLTDPDTLRKSHPEYKAGWNSYVHTETEASQAPSAPEGGNWQPPQITDNSPPPAGQAPAWDRPADAGFRPEQNPSADNTPNTSAPVQPAPVQPSPEQEEENLCNAAGLWYLNAQDCHDNINDIPANFPGGQAGWLKSFKRDQDEEDCENAMSTRQGQDECRLKYQ